MRTAVAQCQFQDGRPFTALRQRCGGRAGLGDRWREHASVVGLTLSSLRHGGFVGVPLVPEEKTGTHRGALLLRLGVGRDLERRELDEDGLDATMSSVPVDECCEDEEQHQDGWRMSVL